MGGQVSTYLVFLDLPGLGDGRRDQSGRDGNHSHPYNEHKKGKDLAPQGDGIYIPVSHSGQSYDGPPKAVEDGGEHLGLGLVFKEIDPAGGKVSEDARDDQEEDDLLFYDSRGNMNSLHGPVVPDEFQSPEDPEDAESPKCPQIECPGQIERQDGKQVDDPVKTENIPPWMLSDEDAEEIFSCKNDHTEDLKGIEHFQHRRVVAGQGLYGKSDQGGDDKELYAVVKDLSLTGGVVVDQEAEFFFHVRKS